MAENAASASPEEQSRRRACDQCRIRKIRCDNSSPCANCQIAARECSFSGMVAKRKALKQRVLISQQYEKKIDLIEERLLGIESVLQTVAAATTNMSANKPSFTPWTAKDFPQDVQPQSMSSDEEDDIDSVGEVDLLLASQGEFAQHFVETAISNNALNTQSPCVQSALSSLRQIVRLRENPNTNRDFKLKLQQPLGRAGLNDLPMPPMSTVVSLLKRNKNSAPGLFSVACSFVELDTLLDLCRKVYFCVDTISPVNFIVVNGAISNFFADEIYHAKDALVKAQMESYFQLCQVNLETALATLPLALPPKQESVTALFIAACYTVNISKPSLAWQYNSSAAALCHVLGYHRTPTTNTTRPGCKNMRTILFWHVYALDRTLALRLGLSAVTQNWNITLPRKIDSGLPEDPWDAILRNWIEESDLGYRVYEYLYSPAALTKSENERRAIAHQLEKEQKEILSEAAQIRQRVLSKLSATKASELISIYLRGDEITYRSITTLIHSSLLPPETSVRRFTEECIDSARFTLQLHYESMQSLKQEKGPIRVIFVHWTISLVPFAPFFLLFCYVIDTTSPEDLQRLDSFVQSLQPVCDYSESIRRLHQLCEVLYNVAKVYVEANGQQTGSGISVNRELGTYLGELGLPPQFASTFLPEMEGGMSEMMHTDQLGNWFLGCQQVMGLLEEDLLPFSEQNGFAKGGYTFYKASARSETKSRI